MSAKGNFSERLKRAHARAELSIKELAIWFDDMSEVTMRTWLLGRKPQAYRSHSAERSLGALETELQSTKSRLPLAGSLRQGERHEHVAAIRKRYR